MGESQDSMENRLRESQLSAGSEKNSQPQAVNPFAKKRSGNESLESKQREIMENVEKFGIKKKVDEKGRRTK